MRVRKARLVCGCWCRRSTCTAKPTLAQLVGSVNSVVARERVRTDRKLAAEGIDPRQQAKENRRANQVSYDHVVDQFVEHYCKPRQWTWDRTQRVLKNCKPLLKRPIRTITKVEVTEMLRSFVAEGHPAKADMAWSWLTTLFGPCRRIT